MGLDMYLYAEKSISSYDYETVDGEMSRRGNDMYDKVIESAGMSSLPASQYGSVKVSKCVGYWRKANAIHGWFIRECANGVDECQDIYVSKENLIRLRDLCVNALSDRDKATPSEDRTTLINITDDISFSDEITSRILAERDKTSVLTHADYESDPLAPVAGFFFGGTEKDEWYYETLERTIDVINSCLAYGDDELQFIYRASW